MKADKPYDLVWLTRAEHEALLRDSKILAALHAGGVGNWEWYSDSINEHCPEVYEDSQ